MLIQLSPNAQLYPLRQVVVAGGTLTVTLGGDLVTLFADEDLTIPTTNPIQLDSSGFSAPFYAPTDTYTLTLRSPEGFVQRTWTFPFEE